MYIFIFYLTISNVCIYKTTLYNWSYSTKTERNRNIRFLGINLTKELRGLYSLKKKAEKGMSQCSEVSVAVKRQYDHGNSYKR